MCVHILPFDRRIDGCRPGENFLWPFETDPLLQKVAFRFLGGLQYRDFADIADPQFGNESNSKTAARADPSVRLNGRGQENALTAAPLGKVRFIYRDIRRIPLD